MGVEYNRKKIVTDGLVLYIDAGNIKSYFGSGNNIIDLSNTQENGTILGDITYSSGTFIGGTTGSATIDIPHSGSLNFANQLSVSVWVSGNNMYQYAGIIGKPSSSAWTDSWGLYYDENGNGAGYNGVFFYINNWDGTNAGPADGVFVGHNTNGNSFPLTCYTSTYDGANVKLYVNANLANQAAYTDTVQNNTEVLRLMNLQGGYYLPGNLSIAQVYSRALTEAEVIQNFNALRGRFGI